MIRYDARVYFAPLRTFAITAGLLLCAPAWPQQAAPVPKADRQSKNFAGNITELSLEKITVVRSILGGSAQTRTFLITKETRIEGKLRMKSKVTVGFVSAVDGDVARLIVVRASSKNK